ncbi:MAG: hypothetical protein ACK4K3_09415 [Aquabacterium sp.]
MKLILWGLAAFLALLWTGLAWMGAGLVSLVAAETGSVQDLGQAVGQMPIPAWLGWWMDTAMLEATRAALADLLTWLSGFAPELGTLVSWLQPVIWITWGLGLCMLLALGGVGHWFIGRFGAPSAIPRG